jgi:hypothetical protein
MNVSALRGLIKSEANSLENNYIIKADSYPDYNEISSIPTEQFSPNQGSEGPVSFPNGLQVDGFKIKFSKVAPSYDIAQLVIRDE